MEYGLYYFPARDCARGQPNPRLAQPSTAAAVPLNRSPCLDQSLPYLLLFIVFFLVAGGVLSLTLRSASDGTRERRSKKQAARGLDAARVASFLVVTFDAKAWGGEEGEVGPECSVCLLEFGGGDAVRVLPGCGHGFHPECIDPWLARHVTCPVCRSDLDATQPAVGGGGAGFVIDIPEVVW